MSDEYVASCNSTLSTLNQVISDLSPSNTKSLVSEASLLTQSRRAEANAILARLKDLNPDISRQFQLKEDIISELRLRLISSHYPLSGEFSSFIVVSYCWHYPQWPIAPVARPIAPGWVVSRPMVDAVMGLRKDVGEGVWLDKLCINQDNPRDKKINVGAMDIIYRSARRVVILLEDIYLTEEEEIAGLTYSGFYEDMGREVNESNLQGAARAEFIRAYFPRREASLRNGDPNENIANNARKFALNVLGARWFSRAWCAHESRVVPHLKVNNPLFLCYGHDGRVLSFEFRCIHYISMHLSETEPQVDLVGRHLTDSLNDPNPSSLRQRWWRIQRLMPDRDPSSSAMQHLVSMLSFGCAKQGDLMSIALNTSSIPLAFIGDVTSVEDVVWIFSLLVLASNDVVPLVMSGSALRFTDNAARSAISWAARPIQGVVDEKLELPSKDCITKATRDYIELDLLVFNSLPCTASPKALEVASQIIEKHDLLYLGEESTATADEAVQKSLGLMTGEVRRIKGDSGPLKVFLHVWLGFAIDCGLEWTLRFPDVMKNETEDSWGNGTFGDSVDAGLTNAANSLLDHFGVTQDDDSGRACTINKLTRFLTCLLDPRLKFFTISPRQVPCGKGDFAIMPSQSNISWFAVPKAIAHLPAWQKRVWVLEPFDPSADPPDNPKDHLVDAGIELNGDETAEDIFPVLSSDYADRRASQTDKGAWRLRRREIIFGSQPLAQLGSTDDGSVSLLKRQRVYGAEDYDWKAISVAAKEFEAIHGIQQSSKA